MVLQGDLCMVQSQVQFANQSVMPAHTCNSKYIYILHQFWRLKARQAQSLAHPGSLFHEAVCVRYEMCHERGGLDGVICSVMWWLPVAEVDTARLSDLQMVCRA
jgi:hypothetical protein